MFLVSSVKVIPYSARKSLYSSASASSSSIEVDEERRRRNHLLSLFGEVDKYSTLISKEIKKCKTEERSKLIHTKELEEGIDLMKNALSYFEKLGKQSQEHPDR